MASRSPRSRPRRIARAAAVSVAVSREASCGRATQGVRVEIGAGDDVVHQAPGEGAVRVDGVAAEHEAARDAGGHQPGQHLRAAGGGDVAQRHLGQRDAGVVGGDAQVAVQRQLDAGPEAEAVQRRDAEHGQPLEPIPDVALVAGVAGGEQAGRGPELGDVGAGREGARPGPAEEQHPHVEIDGHGVEVAPQLVAHGQVDGVERRGPVQRQRGDAGRGLRVEQNGRVGGRHRPRRRRGPRAWRRPISASRGAAARSSGAPPRGGRCRR